jgi:hypothetical protein
MTILLGDLTFVNNMTIGQFEGEVKSEILGRSQDVLRPAATAPKGIVNSRDIKVSLSFITHVMLEYVYVCV